MKPTRTQRRRMPRPWLKPPFTLTPNQKARMRVLRAANHATRKHWLSTLRPCDIDRGIPRHTLDNPAYAMHWRTGEIYRYALQDFGKFPEKENNRLERKRQNRK